MTDYEKLGAFYLGREHRPALPAAERPLVLYDARDLTTHAVCVGMTGSGKTGLCLGLLEEAALDGVPTIAIDPKGDLGNLLLAFPALRPSDFRPWIDEQEAARLGVTPDALAADVAGRWRDGLAEWGQGPERIERFRQSAEITIYTPGSDAGVPLAVLRSLGAPPPAVMQDAGARRERLGATVAGLLTLLGLPIDPVRGREHVLLSVLLEQAWHDGRDVTLETLIADVQRPPIERIGVMAVDAFAPPAERTALAMHLNALLAAPGFAAWRRGEPLDAARLLYAPDGRPRISIVSIAHLSDRERMFLVTLLLGEIVSWMRQQPGTSSLRAILYMDEVFGYLPPVAEPPSKTALLTLLKQARAHGLGVVLATQNPVDLDYKALSNAGTWFVGRLQTERDKARLLDGLTGAASGGGLDRAAIDARLSSLGKRTFLLHDVHADAPVVMESRWALSYLRGPLTSAQIATLMADRVPAAGPAASPPPPAAAPSSAAPAARPALEPGVPEVFLAPLAGATVSRYAPTLLAGVRLHYVRSSADVDTWRTVWLLAPAPARAGRVAWDGAERLVEAPPLDEAPRPAMEFEELGSSLASARRYGDFAKSLATYLYRDEPLVLWRSKRPKAVSRPDETEGAFRGRLLHFWREERDAAVEKLRRRYAPKLERCERAIRTAEARLERERAQYGHQRTQTAISFGATVLGTLFGRKLGATSVGRATTTARAASRAARERGDIARAQAQVDEHRETLAALDAEFQEALGALEAPRDPADFEVTEVRIPARKSDVTVERLALAWRPRP